MENSCPVCNKSGISDYKSSHIICPQCNTDLRSYLLLNYLKKRKATEIIISIILYTFLILSLSYFFFSNFVSDRINFSYVKKESSDSNIKQMSSGNITSNEKNSELKNNDKLIIKYKVKKNDNLIKIAKIFFDNENMFKKIAEDNNLILPYVLKSGQTILIILDNAND